MAAAYIDGEPAALPDAIGEAARLLGAARYPVIAGLGADIAGARAAIRLAERLRCPFDHLASDQVLNSLGAMRDAGWMILSPEEARRLTDVTLLVGQFNAREWSSLIDWLDRPGGRLRLICLDAPTARRLKAAGHRALALHTTALELPAALAALRARVTGRPVSASWTRKAGALAEALKGAEFGAAIWTSSADRLAIEMLAGLVRDLNAHTRFSSFALPPPDNGTGVAQAAGWLTGFPMRTSFGRGYPEHDPWRFDANRLIADGEADCALWISAYAAEVPNWRRTVAAVSLSSNLSRARNRAKVQIEVGTPGVDHDAVEWNGALGALAFVTAAQPSGRPRVVEIIERIAAALPESQA